MKIRKATKEDLPALLAVFDRARAFMAASGNPGQWLAGYPGEALLQDQIARGVCYVCTENGALEATFCYLVGEDPTYANIYDGAWPQKDPDGYGTIHRLASAGSIPGMAAYCIRWCAAQGLPLRADTHEDNKVMQHLLQKNGFIHCGTILLQDGRPRLAYYRPAEA